MRPALSEAERVMRCLFAAALAGTLLQGCSSDTAWHSVDITGTLPPLEFTMTRAIDSKTVTGDDYKGKIVLLYFGYTFCPDVCPLTLANASLVLKKLGPTAEDVRFLFVTVDPDRDSLAVLKEYTGNFAPEVVGLRGSPDEIASLAKRYRVYYAVTPASGDKPYAVDHSSAIYVFDATGKIRLLVASMSTAQPDIDGLASDLRRLLEQKNPPTFLQRLLQLI
jgi:protein SCO1/2